MKMYFNGFYFTFMQNKRGTFLEIDRERNHEKAHGQRATELGAGASGENNLIRESTIPTTSRSSIYSESSSLKTTLSADDKMAFEKIFDILDTRNF